MERGEFVTAHRVLAGGKDIQAVIWLKAAQKNFGFIHYLANEFAKALSLCGADLLWANKGERVLDFFSKKFSKKLEQEKGDAH